MLNSSTAVVVSNVQNQNYFDFIYYCFFVQISSELVDAVKGSGDAIHKKEETHRIAEANRAFAHFH